MDSSVLIAIITAITSIAVAVIQMATSLRVAKIKEPGTQAEPVRAAPRSQLATETHGRIWWQIIGILVGTNILWIIVLEWDAPGVIHLGAIPWCTCLLAYFRPLRWGYVAGIVTCVSLMAVLSFLVLGGYYSDGDVSELALVFIANSILAAGIAYFRRHQTHRAIISDAAISG